MKTILSDEQRNSIVEKIRNGSITMNGLSELVTTIEHAVIEAIAGVEPVGKITSVDDNGNGIFFNVAWENIDHLSAGDKLYRHPPQCAAVPDGWKLVPIEPTPEMLKEIHLIHEFSERALIVRYKSMISAAPTINHSENKLDMVRKSQRITEQDARKIATSAVVNFMNKDVDNSQKWWDSVGQALLEKLNNPTAE